jgi:hypothetical protein
LVVLVDRGGCTFVKKVRHAGEISGVVSVIVVDDREEAEPYMADDGTGANVNTPSLMIKQADGATIKTYMTNNPTVQITVALEYSIPNPDNRVEWDLWTTVNDDAAKSFKRTFTEAMKVLRNETFFTPHFFLLSGDTNGCKVSGDVDLPCGNQCTNNGRYCAADPDGDLESGLTGANIVRESVRSKCVWKILDKYTVNSNQYKWFDYTDAFERNCKTVDTWNEECSLRQVEALGLDKAAVKKCIDDSHGYEEKTDSANTILEQELTDKSNRGIFTLPFIFVNNVAYHGGLSCPNPIDIVHCGVLGMICSVSIYSFYLMYFYCFVFFAFFIELYFIKYLYMHFFYCFFRVMMFMIFQLHVQVHQIVN